MTLVHSEAVGLSVPAGEGGKTALEAATERLRDATIALSAARAAKVEALREVEEQHAPLIAARQQAFAEAMAAKQKAENEVVKPHEWDGRRVSREVVEYERFSSRVRSRTTIFGVVETYRHGVDLGPGYKVLAPGEPFVRLSKKDGSPGKKTEYLYRFSGDRRWSLADEPKALGTEA